MNHNATPLYRIDRYAITLIAACSLATGCLELDDTGLDGDELLEVGTGTSELQNGTDTTDYHPVVRIENSAGGKCTGTAIADDMLVTAFHCLKSGDSVRDWIKIRKAHGSNASSEGATSSYFIMSEDLYDNYTVENSNGSDYYKRDLAFVKFGSGTFSSYYPLQSVSSSLTGTTLRLIGFGGNDTKSYGDDVVTTTVWKDSNDYAYVRTDNSNSVANTENGDSGGPLLIAVGGSYEVLGVLYGSGIHSLYTAAVESYLAPVFDDLPDYCSEFFKHDNYNGDAWSACGTTGISSLLANTSFSDPYKIEYHEDSNWGDTISSLLVPQEKIIMTLFEHNGFSGNAITFQTVFPFGNVDSINRLSDYGFNDKASSWWQTRTSSPNTESWHFEITRHGKCLDLDGGDTSNGGNIHQWSCDNDHSNQIFNFNKVGNYYQIKHEASGKCLDAANAGTSNGTNVYLWSCHGGDNQLWTLSSNSNTSDARDFTIKGKHSGKCMDLTAGGQPSGSSNGTNIQLWTCNANNANQNFALTKY